MQSVNILIFREVIAEIHLGGDELKNWVREHASAIVETDEDIQAEFDRLGDFQQCVAENDFPLSLQHDPVREATNFQGVNRAHTLIIGSNKGNKAKINILSASLNSLRKANKREHFCWKWVRRACVSSDLPWTACTSARALSNIAALP